MMNATPVTPDTKTSTTVQLVAEGFAHGELVRLGGFTVTQLVDGWRTILTFTRTSDGRTFTHTIDTDGPTHAAEQAVHWWTHDAWHI